jgi:hypothetical protein
MPRTILHRNGVFVEYSTVVMGTTSEVMIEKEVRRHIAEKWGVSSEAVEEYVERAKRTGSSNPCLSASECICV